MKLEIKQTDVEKIQKLTYEFLSAYNSPLGHPDFKTVESKQKAIQRILNKITKNDEEQDKLFECIDPNSLENSLKKLKEQNYTIMKED